MMVFCAWYTWRWYVRWRGSMGVVIPNETLDLFGSRHQYSSDWLVVLTCCFQQGLSCCCFVTINEEGLKLWAVRTGNSLWRRTLLLVIFVLSKAEGFESGYGTCTLSKWTFGSGTGLCGFESGYGCQQALFFAFSWWRTVIKLRFVAAFCSKFGTEVQSNLTLFDDIFGMIFLDDEI